MNVKCIFLPVVMIYRDGKICQVTPDEFIKRRKKTENGNLLLPDGSSPYFEIAAILDRKGNYLVLEKIGIRHEWMRGFKSIWDFTKAECRVLPGEMLTVGQLLALAKSWKDINGRVLRKFLVKQDKDAIFDEVMFREAWEYSYIKLPEEEWRREFQLK